MYNTPTANEKLFLGGLHQSSKDNEVFKILSSFGVKILKVSLKRRKRHKSGKCLGYGVIETNKQDAVKLLEVKHFDYYGRKVTITPFLKGDKLDQHHIGFSKRRIFLIDYPDIKNSQGTVEDYFQSFNAQFGRVEACYMRKFPSFKRKIIVVIFSEDDSCSAAVKFYKSFSATQQGFLIAETNHELKKIARKTSPLKQNSERNQLLENISVFSERRKVKKKDPLSTRPKKSRSQKQNSVHWSSKKYYVSYHLNIVEQILYVTRCMNHTEGNLRYNKIQPRNTPRVRT